MSVKRVVVTGLGTTNPVGGDVSSTWEALVKGQSGVRHLDDSWAEDLPVKIAGRIAVEPTEVLERVKARRLDRSSQFAMVAAMEAWRDAGLEDSEVDRERVGVAMASGIGGVTTLLANYDILLEKGPRRVSPLAVPMLMPNAPAANISLYVGARAAVNTPVSACASGNEGIALALDQIRLGRADVVLAGGTEAAIHPLPMAAFANMMALSKNTGDPTTQYYDFLGSASTATRAVQQYARDVATRLSGEIEDIGPFELITRGDELPVFAFKVKDEIENYTVFDVSNALRERGWQVPAYTFPKNREDLAALRVVVRRGFTHDMADLLLADLRRQLPRLESQPAPVHDGSSASGFRH